MGITAGDKAAQREGHRQPSKKEEKKQEAVVEAVLFTMGESVEISRLADVIEEDVRTTKEILKGMEERYGRGGRAAQNHISS